MWVWVLGLGQWSPWWLLFPENFCIFWKCSFCFPCSSVLVYWCLPLSYFLCPEDSPLTHLSHSFFWSKNLYRHVIWFYFCWKLNETSPPHRTLPDIGFCGSWFLPDSVSLSHHLRISVPPQSWTSHIEAELTSRSSVSTPYHVLEMRSCGFSACRALSSIITGSLRGARSSLQAQEEAIFPGIHNKNMKHQGPGSLTLLSIDGKWGALLSLFLRQIQDK